MKRILTLSLVLVSIFVLSGCGKTENKNEKETQGQKIVIPEIDETTVKNIETCKDCVFAVYTEAKTYGENGSVLKDYTKDYKTLKDAEGNQINSFLGHILDKDGKILKGYVCGIENEKLICLEVVDDETKYNANRTVLVDIYGSEKCYQDDTYLECKDNITISAYNFGDVFAYSDGYKCAVYGTGTMNCWE